MTKKRIFTYTGWYIHTDRNDRVSTPLALDRKWLSGQFLYTTTGEYKIREIEIYPKVTKGCKIAKLISSINSSYYLTYNIEGTNMDLCIEGLRKNFGKIPKMIFYKLKKK
jgi:hypothetical protein